MVPQANQERKESKEQKVKLVHEAEQEFLDSLGQLVV